ncbi:Uncharacterised protein [Vibrio cholerae]|nr:Uncharacterised protein [Vibrio cholerae]
MALLTISTQTVNKKSLFVCTFTQVQCKKPRSKRVTLTSSNIWHLTEPAIISTMM